MVSMGILTGEWRFTQTTTITEVIERSVYWKFQLGKITGNQVIIL